MSGRGSAPDPAYERLGVFYLGRRRGPGAPTEDPAGLLLYDSRDLCTHAFCVGMTGSGKTGLMVGLLEEAALDGIPALVVDPKGDLANLALAFPRLAPSDLEPWIDPGEALRAGQTVPERAAALATRWREGLAAWGQDPARIARLREAAEVAVYTPGSSIGRPVRLLGDLQAPPEEVLSDPDALRLRLTATGSSLLGLLGVDADPLRSREFLLLSGLLERAWREGRDLSLPALVQQVLEPPFRTLGVMPLDSFFPQADRFQLAMVLNGLLASPSFAAWGEGPPLDPARLLWTESGKPRLAVLSIAHLEESQRMFFVTALLQEVVAWMRTQSGTTSLRAILAMDEIHGFFPPVANPPSKPPMLTLLKQARAFGLGVVLATQNPVDLDYKGLANCGTWFLGRLQTERDRARVLDGLEGAAQATGAPMDRREVEQLLSSLGPRMFLMNDVHEDGPVLFETRHTLSFLRGPLTREEIRRLGRDEGERAAPASPAGPSSSPPPTRGAAGPRPVLPAGIPQAFAAVEVPGEEGERLVYRPALLAEVDLHYVQARQEIDCWRSAALLARLGDEAPRDPWLEARELGGARLSLEAEPEEDAGFAPLPDAVSRPKSFAAWEKSLRAHAFRTLSLELLRSREPALVSLPEEDRATFVRRLRQGMREGRDLEVEKLRQRFAARLARLQEKVRRAEQKVETEQEQLSRQKQDTAFSFGTTMLGALMGRRVLGRATTAVRKAGKIDKERRDVERARETLEDRVEELRDLEEEFAREVARLEEALDPSAAELEELRLPPRKGDLAVRRLELVWIPEWQEEDGDLRAASGLGQEEPA